MFAKLFIAQARAGNESVVPENFHHDAMVRLKWHEPDEIARPFIEQFEYVAFPVYGYIFPFTKVGQHGSVHVHDNAMEEPIVEPSNIITQNFYFIF